MGLRRAVGRSLARYAEFGGRATRAEFWWFLAFRLVITTLLVEMFGTDGQTIALLALFVPGIASGSRRLHDVGRSGWWQLLALTGVGLVPLLWWWGSAGDAAENPFGPPDPPGQARPPGV